MASKPILFNTEMVRAILDGRKTQTRRLVKEDKRGQWVAVNNARNHEYGASVPCYLHREVSFDDKSRNIMYPKYDVGDILWVRETWLKADDGFYYKADVKAPSESEDMRKAYGYKWKPSIHMPREAARIFLRVTNVRVERLQEITPLDAWNEGCRIGNSFSWEKHIPELQQQCRDILFKSLWDNLNEKRGYGWDTNPWVWVYEFERVSEDGSSKDE